MVQHIGGGMAACINMPIDIAQPKTRNTTLNLMDTAGKSIGRSVSTALLRAVHERRIVVGVAAAVKELLSNATAAVEPGASAAGDVLFCVLAPAAAGDSAMHMHTTLLEAFCYENGIYIVKVDSAAKLTRLLNVRQVQTCALIRQRSVTEAAQDSGGGKMGAEMTVSEEALADHCEEWWDMQQPIVQLPD